MPFSWPFRHAFRLDACLVGVPCHGKGHAPDSIGLLPHGLARRLLAAGADLELSGAQSAVLVKR